MDTGEAIEYSRVELMSGGGDQVLCEETSHLLPHIKPFTRYWHGTLGFGGVCDKGTGESSSRSRQ